MDELQIAAVVEQAGRVIEYLVKSAGFSGKRTDVVYFDDTLVDEDVLGGYLVGDATIYPKFTKTGKIGWGSDLGIRKPTPDDDGREVYVELIGHEDKKGNPTSVAEATKVALAGLVRSRIEEALIGIEVEADGT